MLCVAPESLGPRLSLGGVGGGGGRLGRHLTEAGLGGGTVTMDKDFFGTWKPRPRQRIHFSNKRRGITWQITASDQINYSFHFPILFGGEL